MILVEPAKIESELLKIWESIGTQKIRACLFNLIVYNSISERTDYIREIVQKVSEKYPCRVIFITFDPKASNPYLKTAVSVVGNGKLACDYIDIGVAGKDIERVGSILLPHLIPDLPVSLLWTDDCIDPNPIFDNISKLCTRIIFDSEATKNLYQFARKILSIKESMNVEIADLNWARTERWRDLIASLFHSSEKLDLIDDIRITYNSKQPDFYLNLEVQSLFMLYWIKSRIGYNKHAEIHPATWDKLGPGTIISCDLALNTGQLYQCARNPKDAQYVSIQLSNPEHCEVPYQFVLGASAIRQTLVQEIIKKDTSSHFIDTLKTIIKDTVEK